MPKDYAKKTSDQPKKHKGKHWLIISICLIVLVGMAFVFFSKYLTLIKHGGKKTEVTHQDKKQAELKALIAKKRALLSKKDKPKTKFDFYTLLSKMKVNVPKQTVKLTPGHANYKLQFASVKTLAQATALQNKLGDAGVAVNVQPFKMTGSTWFRVISEPFNTKHAAELEQQSLRANNIDSLLIKNSATNKPSK